MDRLGESSTSERCSESGKHAAKQTLLLDCVSGQQRSPAIGQLTLSKKKSSEANMISSLNRCYRVFIHLINQINKGSTERILSLGYGSMDQVQQGLYRKQLKVDILTVQS